MSQELLDAYRLEGFEAVDGWGVDGDLIDLFVAFDRFQTAHGISGTLCEIGVHHGRTLILLALLKKAAERVIGVDLFEGAQDQNLDASGSGSLDAVRRNLERFAAGVPVELIGANSFALSEQQREQMSPCRLFHIDGGHFLEVVLNDLEIAQRSLGVGGVIVIDDYWHSLFPEVHEAVHRYFATASAVRAVPFMTGRNKIFLAHTSHRDRLLAHMREFLPERRQRPVRLLGYPSICCDLY